MGDVTQAKPEDAPLMAELYCKAFRATGFDNLVSDGTKREELIVWVEGLCEAGKVVGNA
jgi:hypothetical protein